MKTIIHTVLYLALVVVLFTDCTSNSSSSRYQSQSEYSSSNQQSQVSKYDRPPYAVYVYDGDKEIVLYQNPKTATVNGKSGSWSESNYGRIYAEYGGRKGPTVYVVHYGDNTLVISKSEELVFFGTEKEAEQNENNKYKWQDCIKKRL